MTLQILRNFVRLCEETSVEVVPRTPLIPGITATEENLEAIRRFVAGRRCRPLVELPYNPTGDPVAKALEPAEDRVQAPELGVPGRDGPLNRRQPAPQSRPQAGAGLNRRLVCEEPAAKVLEP